MLTIKSNRLIIIIEGFVVLLEVVMLVPCVVIVFGQLGFAAPMNAKVVLFHPNGDREIVKGSLVVFHVSIGLATQAVRLGVRVVFEACVTQKFQSFNQVS